MLTHLGAVEYGAEIQEELSRKRNVEEADIGINTKNTKTRVVKTVETAEDFNGKTQLCLFWFYLLTFFSPSFFLI